VNQLSLVLLLGQYDVPSQQALSLGILGLAHIVLFALIGLIWQLYYVIKEQSGLGSNLPPARNTVQELRQDTSLRPVR
jgi:uncharacterized membrane protein YqjE